MQGNCRRNASELAGIHQHCEKESYRGTRMSMYLNFPPPANWQDFQVLALRLVEQVCDPITVREYGRQGQRQNGVDVYGEMPGALHLGVQCKEMKTGKRLTLQKIVDEAELAKAFMPNLDTFVIATTLVEDTALHNAVTSLNQSSTYPFRISYWSWSHFNDKLNRSSKLMQESYKNYASGFDANEHLLELEALHEGFSRPAFLDDFHHELSNSSFIEALGDTALFLQSGLLRDRHSGELLRGAYPLAMLPAGESRQLRSHLLKEVRDIRARALRDHANGQLDASRAPQYNALRFAVIAKVNYGLVTHGIPTIVPLYNV